ncbi:glycoside hydrolase family 13 protein [Clostridium sp.]|uniref:glycoside hydrolase family 13 protein n=1 Tax=Clostridium sp. TaxID=1506 RepID=UPI002FC77E13
MKKMWWKEAIGYQIYPRSFKDSNGDGIGDIKGIISKLDYLVELGINLIWICPVYESPNDDNGYDISDYQNILKDFGNMEDFDLLMEEVHKRDMKLIIDLVINHTSDEHKWFIESKSSKNNPKRDWYIWKSGEDNKEPNNWESIFKGSVWEYDENTDEYYMHLFTKKQPDLNWENKEVREELYKMINWWLAKGIDGFRVDAISHIKKEEGLKNMESEDDYEYVPSFEKHMNVPGIHDFLKELKEETFDKYDIVTVGEANGVSADEADMWVGEDNGKFSMVFQFEHLDLWNNENDSKFSAKECKKILTRWQQGLEGVGWNALFIENHDITRAVSTWGNDTDYWRESATALALMYFMQKGTPFIYQGQEIGMTNVRYDSVYKYDDVKCINEYRDKIENGICEEEALKVLRATSRDNSRTPMQWDNSRNAGFTSGEPWIEVNSNYENINVKREKDDNNSILNFYKKMIKLKKDNLALIYGVYELILEDDDFIYAYTRTLEDEKYIIITNLSLNDVNYSYDNTLKYNNLLINNYEVSEHDDINEFVLKPYECRMYKL